VEGRVSFRSRLAPSLDRFGGLDLAASVSAPWAGRDLTILMYHRVAVPGAEPLLSDRVISATPDEFAEQMEWVARHASPVGFKDLLALESTGHPLPRRAVLVTFDDGYLDNYLSAFPALKRHRIPATIFLVTGLVGTREPFWWDLVFAAGSSPSELERLKHLPDRERQEAVGAIAEGAGLRTDSFPRTLVSWAEVKEMAAEGIGFGGHTVTHPILSKLSPSMLAEEIDGCRSAIVRELGEAPLAFAYPVGRAFAVNDEAVKAVERAGFRYAVTTDYGRNPHPAESRFRLRRIGVGLEDSLARFKAKLLAPSFFASKGAGGYFDTM
jgi:peptidoglycan/xylan/chitin deacetylase (PgdA/CDA1 family)